MNSLGFDMDSVAYFLYSTNNIDLMIVISLHVIFSATPSSIDTVIIDSLLINHIFIRFYLSKCNNVAISHVAHI